MLLCDKVILLVSCSSYSNAVLVPAFLFTSASTGTGTSEILNSDNFIGYEYKYKYVSNNCNDY